MLNNFVWFENSEMAINTHKTTGFHLENSHGEKILVFTFPGKERKVISDKVDIYNFFKNVALIERNSNEN